MSEKEKILNNIDRLLTHLKEGSLAFRLVQVYHDSGKVDSEESMKSILSERLEQVRKNIASTKD